MTTTTKIRSALASTLADVCARAEARKREIDEEIRHYPTPIPRCDAQFNRLFAERDNLAALIGRAKEFEGEDCDATRIEEWLAQVERAIESAR